jgi:ribonuclease HII
MALPDFRFEREALDCGAKLVCGIDEAGRGPWAGPVVAAAVILDSLNIPDGLDDSKKLSEARRETLFQAIMASADVGVGIGDLARIERDNILGATLWAMAEATSRLERRPDHALVDGNRAPSISIRVQTIVAGDARSLSVAAASIVAKVTRDRMMRELDAAHPGYGLARHKGYGTRIHQAALAQLGPCACHRMGFAPIRALLAFPLPRVSLE